MLHGFKTINHSDVYEETEKRSRFISYSFEVENEIQAENFIKSVKEKHHDAKHHVYAYVLAQSGAEKYCEDGEPPGTSGTAVINAVKSMGLKNVLVIVVRYFGGILLGPSGLRKMYGGGAKNVLLKSGEKNFYLCTEISASVDYKKYGKIINILSEFKTKILNIIYGNMVELKFCVEKENLETLLKKLTDALKGNENIKILSDSYQILKEE